MDQIKKRIRNIRKAAKRKSAIYKLVAFVSVICVVGAGLGMVDFGGDALSDNQGRNILVLFLLPLGLIVLGGSTFSLLGLASVPGLPCVGCGREFNLERRGWDCESCEEENNASSTRFMRMIFGKSAEMPIDGCRQCGIRPPGIQCKTCSAVTPIEPDSLAKNRKYVIPMAPEISPIEIFAEVVDRREEIAEKIDAISELGDILKGRRQSKNPRSPLDDDLR